MRFRKPAVLLVLLVVLGGNAYSQTPSPTPNRITVLENNAELRELYLNINQKCLARLSGEMWTLTHAYESKAEVDKVLDYFIGFFKAIESDDAKQVAQMNGAQGFKETFSKFLDSKDEAVQAFSLFMLGCAGDRAYAPKIAKIVNERDPSFNDRFSGKPTFVRGRAALALGALQASEYKPNIAKLLKSKNDSDRSGAISAFSEMKALEFTDEIVAIMTNKEFAFDDDDSPIYFLIETKQAEKFKKEIVRAMLGDSRQRVAETAAYALSSIGAKEYARDIARLLKNEFRQGDAAKALALMGASEYADEIAGLLESPKPLSRNDAAIALGILGSQKHLKRLADILRNDSEGFVRHNAADALLLLGATPFYKEALKELEGAHQGVFISDIDFHPFVVEKVKSLSLKLQQQIEIARKSVNN